MRVLGIGSYCDLGSIYLRLAREGHEVRVHTSDEDAQDVLANLVERVDDVADALSWIREAGDEHLVLFEDMGWGAQQDELRRDGLHVLGGSALGDSLEQDRDFGQRVLRDAGMRTAPTHRFESFDDGARFLGAHPGRYVLKFNGSDLPSSLSYVGARRDGADVAAMLARHARTWERDWSVAPSFVLMEHVEGIETGFGAFFDGTEFVGPVNLDWEHKRLFPGDLGELTGEMGTVVTYRGGERLFDATLGRLAPLLREANHVGYVNLNTIINEDGVWPLELTCRFGYPGFAILSALFDEPCGDILAGVARGTKKQIATHPGFAVGIVLTLPPFPNAEGYEELSKGTPIGIPDDLTDAEREHLHVGEMGLVDGQLVATGIIGYTMVVTGRGPTIEDARTSAYRLAEKIVIPNVRYRNDIGTKLRDRDYAALAALGWVPSSRR
ncbi:MAG: phosphoribosylglycinamide synthetase C domain-containing protein [Kofleriaceae bacterium]